MSKLRLATVWLDGCSGLSHVVPRHGRSADRRWRSRVDLVYSPLVDVKEFPEEVDITLVEGAVSSEEDLHKIRLIRAAHQDAGFAGRLRRHRQRASHAESLWRGSGSAIVPICENATLDPQIPNQVVPKLLPRARPVHEVVAGGRVCSRMPAVAPTSIFYVLTELLEGRKPELSAKTRFGA